MARDSLSSLIRLRRAACDDAQRSVVCCLAAEGQAESVATEADRAIIREMQAASDLAGDDGVVEAFAAWLPTARHRAEQARASLERLQAETARARAALTACRTALETVETLQKQRVQAVLAADARRWQAELDEAGRPAFDATSPGAAEDG